MKLQKANKIFSLNGITTFNKVFICSGDAYTTVGPSGFVLRVHA